MHPQSTIKTFRATAIPQLNDSPLKLCFSFHKLIERLDKYSLDDHTRSLLEKIVLHSELTDGITTIAQLNRHEALISQLLSELFPHALTTNEIKAVSIPYQGFIFNLSERFKSILEAAGTEFDFNIRDFDPQQFYVFNCCIILNQFYGTNLDFTKPIFYDIPAAEGYLKHYRILYNIDFIEIIPTEKALRLSGEEITQLISNYEDIALWREKFPVGSWILKGFAIMTLFDVTLESAVSILKTNLIDSFAVPDMDEALTSIFRSIFRMAEVQAGFTAFNQEDDQFHRLPLSGNLKSFILADQKEGTVADILYGGAYRKLIGEHTYFSVADVTAYAAAHSNDRLVQRFLHAGIQSFILAPVVKNKILIGVLELASPRANQLNSINANKLDNVMSYITDAVGRRVSEMRDRVRAVIQRNYTTLHPSVYWRFMAEALNYIEATYAGQHYEPGEIIFRDVYPLYGEVDIKDSSVTRNQSIQSDLHFQLMMLLAILQKLRVSRPLIVSAALVSDFETVIHHLSLEFKADTEHTLTHYLALNIYPLLRGEDAFDEQQLATIGEYFAQLKDSSSLFYLNRRNYEKTITLVNENLATILDRRQTEAQAFVAHYFERFKTDGVEHNLYIGPSILRSGEFDPASIQRLRLWELTVIAEMQIAHYHLRPSLPYHLDVASLILAFNTPIAIRFRMDEKHFDIDGAYNIRYEVIKKRIDKAHIKNAHKRITLQGKIVVIYSDSEEEKEYQGYIRILQHAGILEEEIEYFDVEDLQGVSGLKAIRVGTRHQQAEPLAKLSYDDLYQQLS